MRSRISVGESAGKRAGGVGGGRCCAVPSARLAIRIPRRRRWESPCGLGPREVQVEKVDSPRSPAPGCPAMPAQLVALNDGPSILLDKPILLIGRHPECDIQIDSRKVSRRHCCIAQVEDYLVVRDLDSTNGIRINGQRVVEGRLNPGDELTIGSHSYQVTWDGGVVAPP